MVIFIDHATLKYLFNKGESKLKLLRWILLLQEFYLEMKDEKGVKNVLANHLSRLENEEVTMKEKNINEEFQDEHLMEIGVRPSFADMANYRSTKNVLDDYTWQ